MMTFLAKKEASFLSKNYYGSFWATFGKTWATFYFNFWSHWFQVSLQMGRPNKER